MPKLNLGGTIRSRTAAETLAIMKPRLQEFGITRVARITGLDHLGISVSVAIRPNAKNLSTAQGKGIIPELADISAVMECVESYFAENIPEPQNWLSFKEMSEHADVLHPNLLPPGARWSIWNDRLPMRWTQVEDLMSRKTIMVPFIVLTMDSTIAHTETAILEANTNGLASGNDKDEAVCHGLLEIIERESEFAWESFSQERKDATLIDQSTIDVPQLKAMIEQCEAGGVRVLLWNTTGSFEVPTFRCILVCTDLSRGLGRYHGSGAHFSKEIALSRALTEAAQARLTWIHGTREDVYPALYEDNRETDAEQLMMPQPVSSWADMVSKPGGPTIAADRSILVETLRASGFENAFCHTYTPPNEEFSVVKLIVPGMRFSGNRI